ncbi:MAG: M23 family metallopeptidase [Deltaproteobacteria bacterium]|nr:M23 family metallopeptidase [Deltaproteobacteria bacterium]
MKNLRSYVIILLIAFAALFWWLFGSCLELEKPTLQLQEDITTIGRQKVINLTFRDSKSGLRSILVTLTQGDKTVALSSEQFPEKGLREKTLALAVSPYDLKFSNGTAVLTVSVDDRSLFKNKKTLSRSVQIDMVPPQIFLMNTMNHINPGGACVVTFRTSKPITAGGVWVNDRFFRGYPVLISNLPALVTYFALPFELTKESTKLRVAVRDQAGNEASTNLPFLVMEKKFRSDRMELSDAFLQQKMPEFQIADPSLRGKTPIETFVTVNGIGREQNFKTIQTICRHSEPKRLWQESFLRMNNAAPMALFGDRRTYIYRNEIVGNSIHLGVDLASTMHSPVEASNNGIVVFTGPLGIYGNTVIIDHGLGLHSLYAHLSSLEVRKGQSVKRGDSLGSTGTTGLAGGDHLHFSIIVGGEFVNPQEWWDPHWIKDNVDAKMVAF